MNIAVFTHHTKRSCIFCNRKSIKYHLYVKCNNSKVPEWKLENIEKIKDLFNKEDFKIIENKNIYDMMSWIFFNPDEEYYLICERLMIIKVIVTKLNHLL